MLNQDYVNPRIELKNEQQILNGSECFYFESNTNPVPLKKPGKNDPDPSTIYLDQFVYKNALEQTGDPAVLGAFSSALQLIKPLLNPANMFKFFFFGLIIYSLVRSLLGF